MNVKDMISELESEQISTWFDLDLLIDRIRDTMHIRNYVGSMLILNLMVMFGMGTLLLLKPMPIGGPCAIPTPEQFLETAQALCTGVDFKNGANFLMLGPFMKDFIVNNSDYMNWLMVSLTAFQFGFGGAFIYFLTHLVRSYFTLDLTPDLFVSSSVRMLMGSVLSIVMCFALVRMPNGQPELALPIGSNHIGWLPALSFFIGFFPGRALLFLDKTPYLLLT